MLIYKFKQTHTHKNHKSKHVDRNMKYILLSINNAILTKNLDSAVRETDVRRSSYFLQLNHEAYNVRTIVFMISENTIPYIGTKILWLTKNDHNSTQKAPKSIIQQEIESAGHVYGSVKTRKTRQNTDT